MLRRRDACEALLAVFVVLGVCAVYGDEGFRPMAAPAWSRASSGDGSSARAVDFGDGVFVPKSIPIRRNDAVPTLKREMLYNRQSLVALDVNNTKMFSRRSDVYADKEDPTEAWLSNIARALVVLEDAITNDGDVIEAEGRGKIGKKYKKYMLPLLLAYKLKFFALIPLMMGGLVLLAGSTGFAGFFFALFAATMGLKSGGHN